MKTSLLYSLIGAALAVVVAVVITVVIVLHQRKAKNAPKTKRVPLPMRSSESSLNDLNGRSFSNAVLIGPGKTFRKVTSKGWSNVSALYDATPLVWTSTGHLQGTFTFQPASGPVLYLQGTADGAILSAEKNVLTLIPGLSPRMRNQINPGVVDFLGLMPGPTPSSVTPNANVKLKVPMTLAQAAGYAGNVAIAAGESGLRGGSTSGSAPSGWISVASNEVQCCSIPGSKPVAWKWTPKQLSNAAILPAISADWSFVIGGTLTTGEGSSVQYLAQRSDGTAAMQSAPAFVLLAMQSSSSTTLIVGFPSQGGNGAGWLATSNTSAPAMRVIDDVASAFRVSMRGMLPNTIKPTAAPGSAPQTLTTRNGGTNLISFSTLAAGPLINLIPHISGRGAVVPNGDKKVGYTTNMLGGAVSYYSWTPIPLDSTWSYPAIPESGAVYIAGYLAAHSPSGVLYLGESGFTSTKSPVLLATTNAIGNMKAYAGVPGSFEAAGGWLSMGSGGALSVALNVGSAVPLQFSSIFNATGFGTRIMFGASKPQPRTVVPGSNIAFDSLAANSIPLTMTTGGTAGIVASLTNSNFISNPRGTIFQWTPLAASSSLLGLPSSLGVASVKGAAEMLPIDISKDGAIVFGTLVTQVEGAAAYLGANGVLQRTPQAVVFKLHAADNTIWLGVLASAQGVGGWIQFGPTGKAVQNDPWVGTQLTLAAPPPSFANSLTSPAPLTPFRSFNLIGSVKAIDARQLASHSLTNWALNYTIAGTWSSIPVAGPTTGSSLPLLPVWTSDTSVFPYQWTWTPLTASEVSADWVPPPTKTSGFSFIAGTMQADMGGAMKYLGYDSKTGELTLSPTRSVAVVGVSSKAPNGDFSLAFIDPSSGAVSPWVGAQTRSLATAKTASWAPSPSWGLPSATGGIPATNYFNLIEVPVSITAPTPDVAPAGLPTGVSASLNRLKGPLNDVSFSG